MSFVCFAVRRLRMIVRAVILATARESVSLVQAQAWRTFIKASSLLNAALYMWDRKSVLNAQGIYYEQCFGRRNPNRENSAAAKKFALTILSCQRAWRPHWRGIYDLSRKRRHALGWNQTQLEVDLKEVGRKSSILWPLAWEWAPCGSDALLLDLRISSSAKIMNNILKIAKTFQQ